MDRVFAALREFGLGGFAGRSVLVKLHMGESGNEYYVKPAIVGQFVDELKAAGAKPFLFDTVVKSEGSRDTKEKYIRTAKEHGFGKLGCPVVIGSEGSTIRVKVKGSDSGGGGAGNVYGFEVAKELCGAECVLSIAHGKGHVMTGFGGSVKAFGMGGVSKESKIFIHSAGAPVMKDRGSCRLCGTCAKACKTGAIKVVGKWDVDYSKCSGCERCVRACPYGALRWKEEEFELLLAAAARACLNEFGPKNPKNKPKKKIFVNVLADISKRCDCARDAGPAISPDIGIAVSDDPVAIDAASIDLIEKAAGKSLKEMQQADPRLHVRYAERLGMGRMKYELVRL
jgi:uncharacterized Fe-S center protein